MSGVLIPEGYHMCSQKALDDNTAREESSPEVPQQDANDGLDGVFSILLGCS